MNLSDTNEAEITVRLNMADEIDRGIEKVSKTVMGKVGVGKMGEGATSISSCGFQVHQRRTQIF